MWLSCSHKLRKQIHSVWLCAQHIYKQTIVVKIFGCLLATHLATMMFNYNCLLHVCCYAMMHVLWLHLLAIIQLRVHLGSPIDDILRIYYLLLLGNPWHEKTTCRVIYTILHKLHMVLSSAIKCATIYKLLHNNLSIHKVHSTIL